MNCEQALNQVKEAVYNRTMSGSKQWAILFIDGKIQCKPIMDTVDNGNVFGYFSTLELNLGFTNRQWDKLKAEIAAFFARRQ